MGREFPVSSWQFAVAEWTAGSGCGVVGSAEKSAFEGFDVKPVEKSVDALEGVPGYLGRLVDAG
jgi:hypothetical protein